jgi:hypothetical protein
MKFKSTDEIFSRIRENLSSYTAAGVLDVGKFFFEIKWFINKLGIEMYELDEDVLNLKDYKHEMPCNFYLLESAWLCDKNGSQSKKVDNFQGKTVIYTEKTCEKVILPSCSTPNCDERVLDKITTKEYVQTDGAYENTYNNLRLLALGNKLTKQVCAEKCKNLFHTSDEDISILRRGSTYQLISSLKEPTIYIKYYAYPIDEETGMPLIPDEPIIEKALENHLMHYFFKNLWLNGDDANVQQKIGALKVDAEQSLAEAISYSKLPTFTQMITTARRQRRRYDIYEQTSRRHL